MRVTLVVTDARDVSIIVSQGSEQVVYCFGDLHDLRFRPATDALDAPTVWLDRIAVTVPAGSFEVLNKWRDELYSSAIELPKSAGILKGNADLVDGRGA